MFESLKNIIDLKEREALLFIVQTRTTDYFPDTNRKRPTQEHFIQYVAMVENNYTTLQSYTDQYGWPSQEKLMKRGLSEDDSLAIETSAFLCVQHLDANIKPRLRAENYDITNAEILSTWQDQLSKYSVVERQTEMLSLMQKDGGNIGFCSYLTDRILRNTDQPQIFGTQGSLKRFLIGDNTLPSISLPNRDIVSIDQAMSDQGFLARRNSNGLSKDLESLETHNPLSFIKEIRDHFPLSATDQEKLNILRQEITTVRDGLQKDKAAKSRHGSSNVHNPQKDALMEQIKEASKGLADVSMSSESKQDIKGAHTAAILNERVAKKESETPSR